MADFFEVIARGGSWGIYAGTSAEAAIADCAHELRLDPDELTAVQMAQLPDGLWVRVDDDQEARQPDLFLARVTDGWPADTFRLQRDLIHPNAPDILLIGPAVPEERIRRGCAQLGIDPAAIIGFSDTTKRISGSSTHV